MVGWRPPHVAAAAATAGTRAGCGAPPRRAGPLWVGSLGRRGRRGRRASRPPPGRVTPQTAAVLPRGLDVAPTLPPYRRCRLILAALFATTPPPRWCGQPRRGGRVSHGRRSPPVIPTHPPCSPLPRRLSPRGAARQTHGAARQTHAFPRRREASQEAHPGPIQRGSGARPGGDTASPGGRRHPFPPPAVAAACTAAGRRSGGGGGGWLALRPLGGSG